MDGRLKPLPWEFQCHAFDKVEDFFIARNQEGIQHISWIYYHHNHNRLLALGENEAEIKFCLTLPAARGLGVYPRVINAIRLYVERRGIKRLFMCVHQDNHSSIKGIEKAGFTACGKDQFAKDSDASRYQDGLPPWRCKIPLKVEKIGDSERNRWDSEIAKFPMAHPLNAFGWGKVRQHRRLGTGVLSG